MVENSNNSSTEIATIVAKLYASAGIDDSLEYVKSELNKAISTNANALGYAFDTRDDHVERMINAFFTAVATFLNETKSEKEDEATALIVQDAKGGFKFAALVEYNADEAATSNETKWSYSTMFSEENLQDLEKRKSVKKFLAGDLEFKHIFAQASYDAGFVCTQPAYMADMWYIIIDSIHQVRKHAVTAKMLDDFNLTINDMMAVGKDLANCNRIHEAGIITVFSGYMLGVHTIAIETRSYLAYPNKILLPEISAIDLVHSQLTRCSAMQEKYGLHSKQGVTVDYEQIFHDLKTLKDLVRAEQPKPAAISDATVKLVQTTLRASVQLIDDLFPEEEAKSEVVSDE